MPDDPQNQGSLGDDRTVTGEKDVPDQEQQSLGDQVTSGDGETTSPDEFQQLLDSGDFGENRTAPEMRKIFEKGGGNLAKPGAVAFGFSSRGVTVIEASVADEESLMEVALQAGADDINDIDGAWEITCDPVDFLTVKDAIAAQEIPTVSAEVTMIPSTMVSCDHSAAGRVIRLLEELRSRTM